MRVLICGSRTWTDPNAVYDALKARRADVRLVMTGCAAGPDTYAESAAYRLEIPVEHYPAKWELHGKRAGYIRNEQMLRVGLPQEVWAFWDGKSRGTAHMIEIARAAGVPVKVFGLADARSVNHEEGK